MQIENIFDNTIQEIVTAEWLLRKLHSQKARELQQRVREGLLPTDIQKERLTERMRLHRANISDSHCARNEEADISDSHSARDEEADISDSHSARDEEADISDSHSTRNEEADISDSHSARDEAGRHFR